MIVEKEDHMDPKDFEFLEELAQQDGDQSSGFPPAGTAVNEYGEIEDDEQNDVSEDGSLQPESENKGDSCYYQDKSSDLSPDDEPLEGEVLDPTTEVTQIAVVDTPTTRNTTHTYYSWLKRSKLAPLETDREFLLFNTYLLNQGGRSVMYVSRLSNLGPQTIQKISSKNSWKQRAEDYDRHLMVQKLKEAETKRHENHLKKLEKYRQDQESLGQQMTLNAARIAFISNATLEKMLSSETDIDIRDLPSMLNTAAKLAEVGKTLQSSALGVDNLLAAIEEGNQ
jgi:hypothetical protein